MNCWICDDSNVVYVDVLDMGWCQKDFDETYDQPPPWLSAMAAKCRAALDAVPESAQPSWYQRVGSRVTPPSGTHG